MISVAVVTGRRRQILLFVQRLGMNAALVLNELIARDPKAPHVIRAAVTLRAGLSDVRRIDGRQGIAGRTNAVDAVTTDTRRDARLAFLFQQLAVNARVVLAFLIHAQGWIKPLHEVCIAVALAAVGRNVERFGFSEVAFAWMFCGFLGIGVRIATMAIVTHQPACFVYIGVKEFRRRAYDRIVQLCVTIDARIFPLSGRDSYNHKNCHHGRR